jgi:hypothetical protein
MKETHGMTTVPEPVVALRMVPDIACDPSFDSPPPILAVARRLRRVYSGRGASRGAPIVF